MRITHTFLYRKTEGAGFKQVKQIAETPENSTGDMCLAEFIYVTQTEAAIYPKRLGTK
jgi:hypothetical protein